MLHRLVYYSAREPDVEVEPIVAKAAERNRDLGVTGLLIAAPGFFVQVLEGPRDRVSGLFTKIASDPRHREVVICDVEEVKEPIYPDWGMAGVFDIAKAHLWSQPDGALFDPRLMGARQLQDFLRLATFELEMQHEVDDR